MNAFDDVKLELVSFNLCPYVNRSVIALLEKGVDFDVTYIDMMNKPDWFMKISPTGSVPLLRVGDEVIFESAIINEFIDEVTPGSLHPTEPLRKAQNRAWIEFSNNTIMKQFYLFTSKDEESFTKAKMEIFSDLEKLEARFGSGPFFNGEEFNLIDVAFAPILRNFDILNSLTGIDLREDYPRIKAWSEALLQHDSVRNSIDDNFYLKFADYFSDSYMGKNLYASPATIN